MLADSPQEVINRQSPQKSLSVAQFLWKMQDIPEQWKEGKQRLTPSPEQANKFTHKDSGKNRAISHSTLRNETSSKQLKYEKSEEAGQSLKLHSLPVQAYAGDHGAKAYIEALGKGRSLTQKT